MKELTVDFSDDYPHSIYFETTSQRGNNIFLISEDFVSETRTVFTLLTIRRKYFNLNYILNLKQFKIEIL